MRRICALSLVVVVALVAWACTDGSGPTGGGRAVPVDLAPRFQLDPGLFSYDPIDRIRLVAMDVETSEVVGTFDGAVDPSLEQWTIPLAVELGDASSLEVIVEIELFSGTSVEWSGRAGPFVVPARTAQSVDVYRGPLDNLDVLSVGVDGPPLQLLVGTSVAVSASVTLEPGSDATPIVFWASTAPGVATVTEEGATTTITAVTPGTTDIIAAAGEAFFEFALEVVPAVSSVVVSPPSVTLSGPDLTAQFTADVTDGFGNPDPDAAVTWRSSNTSVATVDQNGFATSVGPGTAQIEATSFGVTGSATLTVEDTPGGPKTWVGGDVDGSTAWENPNNWSPVGVPLPNDDVLIPSTEFQPVMLSDESVGSLEVAGAVTVNQGGFTLTVARDLTMNGTVAQGLTHLDNPDPTAYAISGTGQVDELRVSAPRTLDGPITFAGDLDVRSELTIGAVTTVVNGDLIVQTADGSLVMDTGEPVVAVNGNITFDGASSVGNLTAGVLAGQGDFRVSSTHSATAFQAGGVHLTYLLAQSVVTTISFDNPGPSGQHFADLQIFQAGQTAATVFASDALVTGTLYSGTTVLRGNGSSTLEVVGTLQLDVVAFDGLPLRLISNVAPNDHALDNLTFFNMPPNVDHLHVELPGAGANFPLTISSPVFVTVPSSTYYHLRGVNAVPTGETLHIELFSPSPSPPPSAAYIAEENVEIIWP